MSSALLSVLADIIAIPNQMCGRLEREPELEAERRIVGERHAARDDLDQLGDHHPHPRVLELIGHSTPSTSIDIGEHRRI